MKNLILLLLLITVFTAKARTTQQDSTHRAYHLMHKKNPYHPGLFFKERRGNLLF
jgi:hypothetical protein